MTASRERSWVIGDTVSLVSVTRASSLTGNIAVRWVIWLQRVPASAALLTRNSSNALFRRRPLRARKARRQLLHNRLSLRPPLRRSRAGVHRHARRRARRSGRWWRDSRDSKRRGREPERAGYAWLDVTKCCNVCSAGGRRRPEEGREEPHDEQCQAW